MTEGQSLTTESTTTATPTPEERRWASYAHGTMSWMILIYFWPAAVMVCEVLMEVFQKKSRYVVYHARQTLYLELLIILFIGPAWITSKFTTLKTLAGAPKYLLLAWTLVGILIYTAGIIGALNAIFRTRRGEDFEYWLIGRWARKETAASGEVSNG